MNQAIQTLFPVPIELDISRRDFLAGLIGTVGFAGISDLTSNSIEVIQGAADMGIAPEVLFDDISPIQKEVRRMLGLADAALRSTHTNFSNDEIVGPAVAAGCDFAIVQEGLGEAIRPKRAVQVERRHDGRIVVYEDGAVDGIVLQPEQSSPMV